MCELFLRYFQFQRFDEQVGLSPRGVHLSYKLGASDSSGLCKGDVEFFEVFFIGGFSLGVVRVDGFFGVFLRFVGQKGVKQGVLSDFVFVGASTEDFSEFVEVLLQKFINFGFGFQFAREIFYVNVFFLGMTIF